MVEMMKSGNLRSSSKCRNEFPVKLEIVDDPLEEEHAPLNKRSKLWSNGTSVKINLLDEPSPLGLSLKKSVSFQDLIQTRLSQNGNISSETLQAVKKESSPVPGNVDKLKASNFPASILRIGKWEYISRYEGDLVAKCYFAKHKIVWEVLKGGLKSKIEIQWSDIMALKAHCPEDEPGTLTIMLARKPLFFRETNPQPRKHTLWQATSDFTDGQASINREHILQCSQGILNKHFEKLVQCDHRLFHLSRQPQINVDSPFFDVRKSIFEDPSVSGSQNIASPVGAQSSSEHMSMSQEALSPSSVMDARAIEGVGASVDSTDWSQINDVLALMSDEACGNNPEFEDMKQLLLSDAQPDTSDEKSVISKVNSFCNLLQSAASSQLDIEDSDSKPNCGKEIGFDNITESNRCHDAASSSKLQSMSRKDSFSDLLVQLPRITSLPKFLFDISEEDGSDAHNR